MTAADKIIQAGLRCWATNRYTGKPCECTDFTYELGEHPGVCDGTGGSCRHTDLDHAHTREEYEAKRAASEAAFQASLQRDKEQTALLMRQKEKALAPKENTMDPLDRISVIRIMVLHPTASPEAKLSQILKMCDEAIAESGDEMVVASAKIIDSGLAR